MTTTTDFTTAFVVDQSPEEVFKAILNVRGWWSEEIDGSTERLNDEFDYHYKEVHRSRMKIVEWIPNQKVVWYVMNHHFSFTKNAAEWQDTRVMFEIIPDQRGTKLRFTHVGLVPEDECYEVCEEGWNNYINLSLRSLITSGKGAPNPKEGGFNAEIIEKRNLKQ